MSDEIIRGRCSECGGIVSVPRFHMSVVPPVPTCQRCGAVEDVASRLPVIPMKPRKREIPKTFRDCMEGSADESIGNDQQVRWSEVGSGRF